MDFAQRQMEKLYPSIGAVKKHQASLTLDQNLHEPFDDILLANRAWFNQIFLHLGGFQKLMSYMGATGFIMKGSVLEELFLTVYASNTIDYMMNGKAYSHALRGHMLASPALTKLILEQRPECLTGVSKEHIHTLHT